MEQLHCYIPITPRGYWGTIMVYFWQVSAWWLPSPLQAEAGMEFTSCTRMLHGQPIGSTETETHDVHIQSPMCFTLSHHVSIYADVHALINSFHPENTEIFSTLASNITCIQDWMHKNQFKMNSSGLPELSSHRFIKGYTKTL